MSDATSALSVPVARPARRGSQIAKTWRESRAAYMLLAPFLILFVLVLAYPLLYSLYLGFFNATLNKEPAFVGGGNFGAPGCGPRLHHRTAQHRVFHSVRRDW